MSKREAGIYCVDTVGLGAEMVRKQVKYLGLQVPDPHRLRIQSAIPGGPQGFFTALLL